MKTLLIPFLSILVCGCAGFGSGFNQPHQPAPLVFSAIDCSALAAKLPSTLSCASDETATFTQIGIALAGKDGEAPIARALLDTLLSQSDRKCRNHMARTSAVWGGTATSLGVVDSLTSAAGAITFGGQTSQVLSAVSSGAKSSRTTIAKTFFNEVAYADLEDIVYAERAKRRTAIEKEAKNIGDDYQASMALARAETYHTFCGANYGVAQIQKAVKDKIDDAS